MVETHSPDDEFGKPQLEFESRNQKFGKGMSRDVINGPAWLLGAVIFLVVTGVITYFFLKAIS